MNTTGPHAQGITHHAKGCVIRLTVSPRSPANRIEIDANQTIRVRLTARPVEGAANASLLKFLAAVLDVPRSNLTILAGTQARHKRILAEGPNEESVWRALSRAAGLEE
jgi:uncharacterized protein (TIGR00251 family)